MNKMSTPVPAPRATLSDHSTAKKPIPLPRSKTVRTANIQPESLPNEEPDHKSSLSRRVRSLSQASKQIADDISEMMNDKKRAMITGTRQSVRRITKRFNSYHNSSSEDTNGSEASPDAGFDAADMDVFSQISFESPLHFYGNADAEREFCSADDFSAPHPSHPPPPLPADCIYDAPASTSGSTNSERSSETHHQNYESVFPIDCSDSALSRSGSWKFYDPVTKVENIYNEVIDNENRSDVIRTKDLSESNEAFDLNENVSSEFSVYVRNSTYENHEIISERRQEVRKMVSASVMLQFDPLAAQLETDPNANRVDSLELLEELFDRDLYNNMSSIRALDEWSSISNESDSHEYLAPPAPPIRFDSLPDDEQPPPSPRTTPPIEKNAPKTSWYTENNNDSNAIGKPAESKRFNWLKQVKGVLEKAPDIVRSGSVMKSKENVVERPSIETKQLIHKKGMLYKVQNGPVEDLFGEYSGRWCHLQNADFVCYADSGADSVKERFPADSILSIQVIQDPSFKYKHENEDLHCFELNTTGRSRGGHVYGSRDLPERRIWMQYLCETLCKKFPSKFSANYTRMGWAYIREGVSGKWMGAWLMLAKRTLCYVFDNQAMKTLDLRKARCIVPQVYQEGDGNPKTNDKGPNIVLDTPDVALYIRMWTTRETKVWCHMIKLAAHNNGANIEEQQLSKNNIPVLVEKCINFIYTHGSLSQGIFRKSGSNKNVSEILSNFRKNAWGVQLTKDAYSEHDVAMALKRFFRDLPEPLLPSNKRQYLHGVSKLKNKEEQIRMYKAALEELSPITYTTAKKLFGHLHFIASQYKTNLMNVDNLAIIWRVPLMTSTNDEVDGADSSRHVNDSNVVSHLILMYKYIFPEDAAEIEQEKIMLQVLKKYAQSPQGAVKNNATAGDLRVWIHVSQKGESYNVAVGAAKTAYEVCVELSSKINLPVSEVILEEVVLNDSLRRPIHHTEKVLNLVLNWGYWDDIDRKDNYLILVPITKYHEIVATKGDLIWDEIRFADVKTRHFKNFTFKIGQGKLNCYKDKTTDVALGSWNIGDIVWYVGHEAKRSPPTRWSVTFIEKKFYPKRTKATPFFGNVISCGSEKARASLLAAFVYTLHSDGLKAPAMHVNLMS